MTVAELIAELSTKDPDATVMVDREHHGNWYMDFADGIEEGWAVRTGVEYYGANESAEGAMKILHIS